LSDKFWQFPAHIGQVGRHQRTQRPSRMQLIGREEESSPGDENWRLRAYCLAYFRLIVRLDCWVGLLGWIVGLDWGEVEEAPREPHQRTAPKIRN